MKKCTIAVWLLLAAPSWAAPRFMRDSDIGCGLVFQTFGYGGQWRVTELAIPYTTTMPLNKALSLDVTAVPAVGLSSNYSTVLGLTNTKLRVSYIFKDLAIFTLGARVPTGANGYNDNELETMGQLSRKAFGFPVSDFMHSVDINATGSGGYAFKDAGPGDLTFGLGVGYLYKGAYSPREGMSYDPGDQLSVSLAAEYSMILMERRSKILVDIGYTNYGADVADDSLEMFQLGSKKNWALKFSSSLSQQIPVSFKVANYWAGKAATGSGGTLQDPAQATVNRDFYIIETVGLPLMTKYQPYAQLSQIILGKDDNNINNGFVFGLGGGGSHRLNERVFLDGSLNLFFGSLDSGNFINGVDLGVKLRYRL